MIELLAELVAECGRSAAYDVRTQLGMDPVYIRDDERIELVAKLRAKLIEELAS